MESSLRHPLVAARSISWSLETASVGAYDRSPAFVNPWPAVTTASDFYAVANPR